jgi:Kef-type K+ transport system membrane component KefB/nucleotide-binding universal stress UspA family protein
MPIQPIQHDALFLLLFQLGVLLIAARFFGELARKIGLPAVVGELSGGIMLGPSVLGALRPEWFASVFPHSQHQSDLLGVVTWLGVIFLLLVTGLETDLGLIRRQGRRALSISLGGIVLPFATGIWLGYALPDHMLGDEGARFVFALFVATAMSISAIPVIARVLMEMKLIRRDIGQLTLAAGMVDDTIGWLLLSLVAGLAVSGVLDFTESLKSILALGAILAFTFTIGKVILAKLVQWVDDQTSGIDGIVSLVAIGALLAGSLTVYIGLEAILGAFLIGIILREAPRYRPEASRSIEDVTRLILAPIFFASAGLKVDLTVFADRDILPWAGLVLGVACLGKFAGAYLGARAVKLGRWESLAMGAGLNARGAMEIIVATIGLSLAVISTGMYSIIVMVAIVTTLMAPPLLRWTLGHVKMSPQEAERLALEERERASYWAGLRRVLMPTRGGANIALAAGLLRDSLQGMPTEVSVVSLRPRRAWLHFLQFKKPVDIAANAVELAADVLAPVKTKTRILSGTDRNISKVVSGFAKDYDLLVIGSATDPASENPQFTFSRVADDILQSVTIPVLVVSSPGGHRVQTDKNAGTRKLKRVLVPTTGTTTSQAAADFAARLCENVGAECTFLFVDELDDGTEFNPLTTPEPRFSLQAPEWSAGLPEIFKSRFKTIRAPRASEAIVRTANNGAYDLIVVGATLRPGTRRAYLGPQVDYVLRHASCPIAVLVSR